MCLLGEVLPNFFLLGTNLKIVNNKAHQSYSPRCQTPLNFQWLYISICMVHLTPVCLNTHIFVMCLQGKVLSHYFTTKQYRIKGFFSGVHACVHGADALAHTLSTPFWEMVMLRKQDTLIL
jgi:hypothetical protein